MAAKVLHLLSQRPGRTGSGVTLDALARYATRRGWEQRAVVGVPADDPRPAVAELPAGQVLPLPFGEPPLAFPVPGMSDVMPYPSTVFSQMSAARLAAYRRAWRAHLEAVVRRFRPDIVHSHHVWIASSLVKDVAPDTPVVTHCHATGLRQMTLCPHLASEVRAGCRRNDRFVVLHHGHAEQLADVLELPPRRIHGVGAGFMSRFFHAAGRAPAAGRLLYVGKLSAAKGLPWLLDAVERLRPLLPSLEMHVAGSGSGPAADGLTRRMRAMAPAVVLHGALSQPRLGELMRTSAVCVLPSFYEGLPLVLVEAAACGCRLVATRLPGVVEQLAPALGAVLELVPLPRLSGPDTPVVEDLPAFVDALTAALAAAFAKPPPSPESLATVLGTFTWRSVFARVEAVWNELL